MSDNPSLLGTVINMRYYFQLADLDGNRPEIRELGAQHSAAVDASRLRMVQRTKVEHADTSARRLGAHHLGLKKILF